VRLDGGRLRIGPSDWEAQGVVSAREADVAAFSVDVFEVTESRWESCVVEGACPARAASGEPGRAVAGVTLTEARRFCSWAGGRLPTPDELAWAAAGAGARRYAWGDTGAVCRRAAWGLKDGPCASGSTGPEIAGSHPDGASPDGIHDLAGNVAEWAVDAHGGTAEVRGGSWSDGAVASLRSWSRRVPAPDARQDDVGLRCAYDDR
jgi:formylglycine-generating enzyme required for sulfatase activity